MRDDLRPVHDRCEIASFLAAALILPLVLVAHLVPPLLAGLLVYELVHALARLLQLGRLSSVRAKLVAVALLATLIITLVTLAILGTVAFFRSEAGSLSALMQKMAEIIEGSRDLLPDWVLATLPANAEALRVATVDFLDRHARDVQSFGAEAGHVTVRIMVGMIVGGMVALHEAAPGHDTRPLAVALKARAHRLADAFRRIVFAQARIAGINAVFTGIYLAGALPLFGVELPYAKTLIVLTFITGMIPVVGNLISNTVIVIVSLNHSLSTAIASLVFLVAIHKLEYFLNARIIATHIRSAPWELLLAMLVMEAVFGVGGVAMAPIYYAYLKQELADRKLV